MAGSAGTKPAKKVTTFSCSKCGAPVSVRYPGHSMSAVCDRCFSVIDTTNDAFRVIETYFKQMQVHPRIELGSRGELRDKTWEVIGFVVREDITSAFKWEEYLLFNPYYGYRWLTCNNGHWSLVTTVKEKPDFSSNDAKIGDKKYKLFYRGRAKVFFVLGEFYWKVAVGEEVWMADYIRPPEMLSMEEDRAQKVWSISEYIEPKVVKEAFNVDDGSIATPVGVAPNQPSAETQAWKKVGMYWGTFLAVLTALQVLHCATVLNKVEYEVNVPYMTKQDSTLIADTKKAESWTSPVFEIAKDKANVEISIKGDVDNSWLYVYGELVNDDTNETFSFERTVEYYHGVDDGESWSEGHTTDRITIGNVPGGKYYFNLDIDNGGAKSTERKTMYLELKRDIAGYANYLWCLLFISILPICVFFRSRATEVARWSDSDYSPYQSSS